MAETQATVTQQAAWKALEAHYLKTRELHLRNLFTEAATKNSIDIKEWFVHRGTSGVEKVTEEARAPGLITVPAWEKS